MVISEFLDAKHMYTLSGLFANACENEAGPRGSWTKEWRRRNPTPIGSFAQEEDGMNQETEKEEDGSNNVSTRYIT